MRILALDPATTTGWAINEIPIVFGHWDLKPHRYESGGMRYIRFKNYLEEINKNFKPDLIVFEEIVFHRTSLAAQVYGGLVAVLMSWADEKNIEYAGVNPGTWKKLVTGKGNADKIKTIKAIMEKYGLQPQDDNEADAIGILKWAEAEYIK
jgi:Holliday junction resolvasome RuvABC endonuclease subunit